MCALFRDVGEQSTKGRRGRERQQGRCHEFEGGRGGGIPLSNDQLNTRNTKI